MSILENSLNGFDTNDVDVEVHPATRTMRAKSPFVVRKKTRKPKYCRDMYAVSSQEKIHRILLDTEITVKVVNVLSPSCIWVRLFTCRLNNCIIKTKDQKYYLEPFAEGYDAFQRPTKQDVVIFNYYMAPRLVEQENNDEGGDNAAYELVYTRVRLLRTEKFGSNDGSAVLKCLVFYIDYGDSTWVLMDSLSAVPKELLNIPWQATPVALFGLSPDRDNSGRKAWSSRHCQILRGLLLDKLFGASLKAIPAISQNYGHWSYDDYARVDLDVLSATNTFRDEDTNIESISVSTLFYKECVSAGLPIKYEREQDEATETPFFGVDESEEIPESPSIDTIPAEYRQFNKQFSRKLSTDDFSDQNIKDLRKVLLEMIEAKRSLRRSDYFKDYDTDIREMTERIEELEIENLYNWDTELRTSKTFTTQIEPITLEFLSENNIIAEEHGSVVISLIDLENCLVSPYEFYGHFVPKAKKLKEFFKANLKLEDERYCWQRNLNNFYFVRTNQRPMDSVKIEEAFKQGERIFGVYALVNRQSEVDMCRVQVLAIRGGDHIVIRFLDRGGTMSVDKRALFRLNSVHSSEPPKAVQFCLKNLIPEGSSGSQGIEIWNKQQRDFFRRYARVDTPLLCRLHEIHNHKKKIVSCNFGLPHLLTEVFYVSDLLVIDKQSPNYGKAIEERMISAQMAIKADCSNVKTTIAYAAE